MIRRPPTIIALGEEDLQAHLHRMFLRTLPENLDRLHLDDPDQNRPRDASSSEDPYDLSDQSDGDRAFNASHRPRGGPSCVGHASLADAGSSLPASINGSTHRTIDPNRAPAATQLISSTRARASQRRDRSLCPGSD
ncbi:hypothetical protein N7462_002242 [Penicillium macrosclerotiorum]|uniref:uncharacterized protein n=1 Tax=Penicillium macrosclerotiorum TaxID=303699 RepID=UPI0025473018|nr:uncharacterized protein N7462_002242 [Penicillium macrosclerotiorum]KAJ5692819.1 hypothetical protein N7462_002242 [Penicillium macrosclerotiorum]